MRLVILADPIDNQRAGVHRVTWNMVDQLAKDPGGHEVILIREKRGEEGWPFEEHVIPNTRLPIGWASFRLFVLIPILCRKLKADAVLEPAHFGPWNLPKHIKRITFIHDLTPIKFPQYHRWHSQLLQRIFFKRIVRKADLLLTNSKHTSKDLAEYYPKAEGKMQTMHLGVDAQFKPVSRPEILKKYHLADSYFLFTGTIEPRKNLTTLLRAYQLFRERGGKAHLVLAGAKGWKTKAFYTELGDHPFRSYIHILGFVPDKDLPALYSHALVFVYPSEYEGFGLPILEAMACGTPVIAAQNSCLMEVGGDAVMYASTFEAMEFANHMLLVTKDSSLLAQYKAFGEKRAGLFSWEAFGTAFVGALHSLNG